MSIEKRLAKLLLITVYNTGQKHDTDGHITALRRVFGQCWEAPAVDSVPDIMIVQI